MTRSLDKAFLIAALAVAAAACATTRTTVTPIEIAQQARPLVQEGRAEVTGAAGVVRVSADETVEVRVREGDLERPMRVTVRELIRGCVDGVTAPVCLASQVVEGPVLERRRYRVDRTRVATGIGVGLMGGVIGYCLANCGDGADDELGKGALYAGGVGIALVGGFLLIALAAR